MNEEIDNYIPTLAGLLNAVNEAIRIAGPDAEIDRNQVGNLAIIVRDVQIGYIETLAGSCGWYSPDWYKDQTLIPSRRLIPYEEEKE